MGEEEGYGRVREFSQEAGSLGAVLEKAINTVLISFSRCALSGSWSPVVWQCQARGSLLIAAGPGFAAFLGLELKYN